ncbi:MAG: hypothetical protein Q7U51_09470 [Methanoregula sp.]|nr:hypothetical protein [Methanoregula sp.]
MTPTKSSEAGIAFMTPQPEQFHQTVVRPISAGDSISLTFMDEANIEVLNRFNERFQLTGIEVSYEELHELNVLKQFLGRHVKQAGICDVQCMLLWSEWVRTFRRQTPGFPKLILEKEFRCFIMDTFGIEVVDKGFRGAVYLGIKFIP